MKYMLDTNICIYTIKHQPVSVFKKFMSLEPGDACISSITLSELMYGVYKSHHPQKNQAALAEFVSPLDIMPFDDEAAEHYGHIRAHLEKKGTPIGALDLLIAAHARRLNSILVTNNKKEFSRVPGIKIEDWVQQ